MPLKTLKYFSTLIVLALALVAGWWLWNFYMQSPWTRDGKVRAEQVSITPQVSGSITTLVVRDNQYVKKGDVLFRIDDTPYHIAILNAQAQLAKAQSDLAKANNEANRRRHLSRNYISAEDLDTANINVKAMQASVNVAEATLKQAQWELTQTVITAPVDGWITNLSAAWGIMPPPGNPFSPLSTATRSMWWVILKRPSFAIFAKGLPLPLRFTAARSGYRSRLQHRPRHLRSEC